MDELADRRDAREMEEQAVSVTFGTRADLLRDEMTDEDWIALGKFVAEMAAMERELRGRS